MENRAVSTVLEISENIIKALDDKSIYERYSKIKNQIMQEFQNSANPKKRQLIMENQDLSNRIKQIKAEYSQADYLHSYIFAQFQILQATIIPNVPKTEFTSFEQAAKSLTEVIDTKLMSHQFLKQKLADENEQLKRVIQTLRSDSVNEIDRIKKKRIDMSSDWERKKERLNKQLREIKFMKMGLKLFVHLLVVLVFLICDEEYCHRNHQNLVQLKSFCF